MKSTNSAVVLPEDYHPQDDRQAVVVADLLRRTMPHEDRRERGHYLPLGTDRLQQLVGRRWAKPTRDALVSQGIIEPQRPHRGQRSVASYSVGRFAGQYRLARQYRTGGVRRVTLTGPQAELLVARRRAAARPSDEHLADATVAWWWHNVTEATLDPAAAGEACLAVPHNQYALAMWGADERFGTFCCYGRLHSSVTCMAKPLRNHLRSPGGCSLSECDVRNSQPLLLGAAARARQAGRHRGGPGAGRQATRGDRTTLSYVPPRNGGYGIPADVEQWVELASAGLLYEHLRDRLHAGAVEPFERTSTWWDGDDYRGRTWWVDPRSWDRSQTKLATAVAIFQPNQDESSNAISRLLRAEFPTIAEHIHQAKVGDHARLAKDLQALEARVVLHHAGAMLRQRGTFAVSIHDSIASTDPAAAAEALSSAYVTVAGVEPTIR